MKILVLNGSPRGNESNTLKLTQAFLNGMLKDQPHQIDIINVQDLSVHFCTGCMHCMRNGCCILNDDMNYLLPKMLSSDVVILSFPLFGYSMSALLKKVVERMLPIYSTEIKKVDNHYEHFFQKDISKIHFFMISTCGFPHIKENFDPVVMQFQTFFRHNNTIITVPEGPLLELKEFESYTYPLLQKLEQAGFDFSSTGFVSNDLLQKINAPIIPEKQYVKWANYEIYLYRERKKTDD